MVGLPECDLQGGGMIVVLLLHQQGHTVYDPSIVDTVASTRRDPYRHPTRARRGMTAWCLPLICFWW